MLRLVKRNETANEVLLACTGKFVPDLKAWVPFLTTVLGILLRSTADKLLGVKFQTFNSLWENNKKLNVQLGEAETDSNRISLTNLGSIWNYSELYNPPFFSSPLAHWESDHLGKANLKNSRWCVWCSSCGESLPVRQSAFLPEPSKTVLPICHASPIAAFWIASLCLVWFFLSSFFFFIIPLHELI